MKLEFNQWLHGLMPAAVEALKQWQSVSPNPSQGLQEFSAKQIADTLEGRGLVPNGYNSLEFAATMRRLAQSASEEQTHVR